MSFSLPRLAVKRPVTISMLTIAIVLFGFVALSRLPVTLLPDLSYPSLTIRTEYLGAAPTEIEQLINRPIEENLGIVKGVHRITSYARANQSDIVLEFRWGTDMNIAAVEVREKLDMVQLPLDIEKPVLLRFNPNLEPVVKFALSGDQDLQRMRRYAEEELKRSFETVSGVAAVRVGGGLEDEIQVLLDEELTAQINISPQTISQRLQEENINQSGGRVRQGRQEYLVRTVNQFKSLEDIENIYLFKGSEQQLQIKDVAHVVFGAKDRTSISRFNQEESIEVNMYREGSANTVQVSNNVLAHKKQIEALLPDGYQLELLSDQSRFIDQAIQAVKDNAISGGLLAVIIIFLFLQDLRATLIISAAIPISIIGTFLCMHLFGLSLNMMSLGGVALAVGMLVDNAIVVLENIARRRTLGDSIQGAAITGSTEVASAVTASTLTTIAVFIPLIFVTGIAGQLFIDQALTVTFSLLVSLFVALTLIPMLASRTKKSTSTAQTLLHRPTRAQKWTVVFYPLHLIWYGFTVALPAGILRWIRLSLSLIKKGTSLVISPLTSITERALGTVFAAHRNSLRLVLAKPKRMFIFLTVIIISLFGVVPGLKTQLIPSMEQQEFYINIEMPRGTHIDGTDATLKDIAHYIEQLEGVDFTYSLAGIGSLMQISAEQGGDYWGRLHVVMKHQLTPEQKHQILTQTRLFLQTIPGLTSRIDYPSLIDIEMPLVIEVHGYHLGRLQETAQRIIADLQQLPYVADIRSGLAVGQPEVSLYFDHAKLAYLDLSVPEVARLVSSKIGGEIASKYNMEDRQVDIRVRLPDIYRSNPEALAQIIINPGSSHELPLAAVADIQMETGPGEITRLNQQRVALISFDIQDKSMSQATQDVQQLLTHIKKPADIQIELAGQSQMLEESFQSLLFALLLAIFLVYLVMASQFESFGHPFLIMFTVPLAGAGALLGLFLTQTPLSVVVFIGFIMLAGIVVNNAIVLIDRINQLREEGQSKTTAIQEASSQRLRPILMTTLTTVLGLFPLALGIGDGAELTQPMAITVISGLFFSTILTLFYIPLLYALFDRKRFHANTGTQSYQQSEA